MPYKKQTKWVITAIALFAVMVFPFETTLAAAPNLVSASIADGATGINRTGAITFDFDTALYGPSMLSSTWSAITGIGLGTGESYNEVFFINVSTGWLVGDSSKIYKTTDGGINWTQKTNGVPTGVNFNHVQFIDASTGYVHINTGKIIKTTDGGDIWTTLDNAPTGMNTYFFDTNTGVSYGNGASGFGMYKTTNGGSTWTLVDANVLPNAFSFINANQGWGVSYGGFIYSTTNAGDSWATSAGPVSSLNDIHFADANTGWIVGDLGVIYKTTNGGSNWTQQTSNTSNNLSSVFFVDANTGWIGGNSVLLKTTNGGSTWTSETIPSGTYPVNITSFDSTHLWAAAGNMGLLLLNPAVTLKIHSPNTQGGTPSGSNLCRTVTLGPDGSSNPNQRITCSQSSLDASTWYTVTIPTAVTSSDGTPLSAQITRTFQTESPATLYVDGTSGTDQVGCGSASGASACRTIQYTANLAEGADTISAAAGTYNERVQLGTKNVILHGNDVATLTDTSRTGSGGVLEISGGQTSSTVIRNWTINVSASTPNDGIKITGASYPIIRNNTCNHNGTTITANCITVESSASSQLIIRNNTIMKGAQSWGHIFISSNSPAPLLIDSNFLRGGAGIQMEGGGNATIVNNIIKTSVLSVSASASAATTAVLVNNTIYNMGGSAIMLQDTSIGGTLTAYVKNNIISGSETGLSINSAGGDQITLYSDYNLFISFISSPPSSPPVAFKQNGGEPVIYSTLSEWKASAGSPDTHSVYPTLIGVGLTDPDNNDFSLANNSVAIGRGTDDIVGTNDLATYSANVDLLDNARPYSTTLPDIGAYENQVMGELTSIVLTAGTSTLNTTTPATQLTATGTYNLGSSQNLSNGVSYTSSNIINVGVGFSGIARGTNTGSSNITATLHGLTSNAVTISTSGLPPYVSIYIDAANGNDTTGIGISGLPYKTINKGASELLPGGRLYLKGAFTGESINLSSAYAGTAANNTWIANWPGQSATINIDGDGNVIDISGADYITIQGFTLTGSTDGAGVRIKESNYITVNNNTIYGNVFGISGHTQSDPGTYHTFANNLIYNNTKTGILLTNGQNNTSIFNNAIYENNGVTGFEVGLGFIGTINTVGIWNNTIVNHIGGGINATDLGLGAPVITNLTAKNNLFAQTAGAGYAAPLKITSANKTGTGNAFDYNLYYTTNNVPLVKVDATNYSTLAAWQAASTHDDNSVNGDPLFINAASDDYRISNSSPAVNAGTLSSASDIPSGVVSDILGVARNTRYDIGAYETSIGIPGVSRPPVTATPPISVNASIRVNLGEHRDRALVRIVNQLLSGSRMIANRISIRTLLAIAAASSVPRVFNDIANNANLRTAITAIARDYEDIRRLLRGQSSSNLILEIWTTGDRTSPLASLPVTTDLFGEGSVNFSLASGNYDFTIRKPFGLRQTLANLTLAGSMALVFPNLIRVGDANGDGLINSADFQEFFRKLGTLQYDFNEDGVIDLRDVADFLQGSKNQ